MHPHTNALVHTYTHSHTHVFSSTYCFAHIHRNTMYTTQKGKQKPDLHPAQIVISQVKMLVTDCILS